MGGRAAACAAAGLGYLNSLRFLLDHGAAPGGAGNAVPFTEAIHAAIGSRQVAARRRGPVVDALHVAAYEGKYRDGKTADRGGSRGERPASLRSSRSSRPQNGTG
ncbi:MAG: hypothetical protein R3F11_17600 [Verrucomicrobiales bacterium]